MNHRGSGKVDVAVAEIHRRTQLRQPSAAPSPASGDRIENRADEKFAEQKRPEGDALADRAHDDVSGGLHEHDFEQRQNNYCRVIGGTDEEESFAAHESPLPAANQEMVQGGNAA